MKPGKVAIKNIYAACLGRFRLRNPGRFMAQQQGLA
jgi:hypothetical protein